MSVDLRKCVTGQKLLSKHGWILTYVKPLDPKKDYYDHEVRYPDGSPGTRTNDGFVFKNKKSRLPEDHDIVEILDETDKNQEHP
jgi:hypothetical protein